MNKRRLISSLESLQTLLLLIYHGSVVADLGREVVLEDAELIDLELSDQRLVLVHAELRESRQVACLVEQVQVVQSELLRNWLLNLDCRHVLFAFRILV